MQTDKQQKRDARRQMLLEGNLLKIIPLIALPQVVTMIIDSLYNLADTYFVSQLGDAATAAVGVNDSMMHLIRALSLAFGMGASSYISRMMGAKEDEKASRAASTTLFTAMGTVAIISIFCFIFVSPLVRILGATENVAPYSIDYARWTLLFAPFTAASVCLSQSLRAEGSTTLAMVGSVSGCIINVFLDPLLITGMGLGVAGAAIATGISKVISAGILFYPYLRRRSMLNISLRLFTPTRELYGEIARMGIPTGLRSSMMAVSNIIINNIAGGFGDLALAAVSVANKCMRLVGSAVMGFGQGFQPIAGFSWGAKKYSRVKKAYLYTSAIGIGLGAILGAFLFIFAREAIELFTDNTGMSDIGVLLIRSQCVVLPAHVWCMISSGIFQATGKAFKAAVLGLSRQVFSLIPVVLLLSWLFGLNGLVYSQAVADVISSLIALGFIIPMIRELSRLQAAQKELGETASESEEPPSEAELTESMAD